jgi:hypothetical protein
MIFTAVTGTKFVVIDEERRSAVLIACPTLFVVVMSKGSGIGYKSILNGEEETIPSGAPDSRLTESSPSAMTCGNNNDGIASKITQRN